ncbi:MAG: ketohexokinase [Gammaproteobacteria bacterium]|nr:ketohexokinase [Gammaproteobacteria bacterium]
MRVDSPQTPPSTRILGVGTATVDIVNEVDSYPAEDSKVRALCRRIGCGGNAANTLIALRHLGYQCSWAGILADLPESEPIICGLHAKSVDMACAVRDPEGETPTSYVTLNRTNGSRTITHYRRLREFTDADFGALDLSRFDWVHFEGRNPPELEKMMSRLKLANGPLCSLEVEKPRVGIERLFPLATVILFSSDYARWRGFDDGESFLDTIRTEIGPDRLFTCAWGVQGAWGVGADGRIAHAPAVLSSGVVDTLGAGDVFNAAVIDGVIQSRMLSELLARACQLAGRKCRHLGVFLD